MTTATRYRGPKRRRPKMSAEEAQTFERFSVANAVILKASLKCKCQPYEDTFTLHRWNAQGYSVRKGEHGIKLPLIKDVEEVDDDGNTEIVARIKGASVVFCRCQVHKTGEPDPGKPAPARQELTADQMGALLDMPTYMIQPPDPAEEPVPLETPAPVTFEIRDWLGRTVKTAAPAVSENLAEIPAPEISENLVDQIPAAALMVPGDHGVQAGNFGVPDKVVVTEAPVKQGSLF